MRKKKCTNCSLLYDLELFECPECHESSCVVVMASGSELKENLVELSDWSEMESVGPWRLPYIRRIFIANGIALFVFIVLAAIISYLRSMAAGPTLAVFAVVAVPVLGLIGVVNISGIVSAVVMTTVYRKHLKALMLLALSVPPVILMTIDWFSG